MDSLFVPKQGQGTVRGPETRAQQERRSDGAYTLLGKHEFYDAGNNYKAVDVSYTLAQAGGRWVIVAVGSSESGK